MSPWDRKNKCSPWRKDVVSSINVPWDPSGDITRGLFDFWILRDTYMPTSIGSLKSDSSLYLFGQMNKFQ